MARGGARPGAGRKVGAIQKVTREARAKAAATGLLPHEFLLAVSRGEMVDDHKPSFEERLDAAKAAAPYYAPKLSSIEASGPDGGPIPHRVEVEFVDGSDDS